MKRFVSRVRSAGWGAILASIAFAVPASGAPSGKGASGVSSKQACVAAHEQAQRLRMQKLLHAAREKYVACARTECPVVVRKECTEQLDMVEVVAPTIVLAAVDEKGASDTKVKVMLDGQLVAERLTGGAIPVEPGEHSLLFERTSDGKTLEQRVFVVEGEKNRKVVADYQALAPKPLVAEPARANESPVGHKRIPVLAFVAGGVALAGLGSFTFFSLSGRAAEDDLATKCAPSCTAGDVAPVKRDYLVADVSLAVAVVAAAAAVVLGVPALDSPKATAALGARATSAAPWMPRVHQAPRTASPRAYTAPSCVADAPVRPAVGIGF